MKTSTLLLAGAVAIGFAVPAIAETCANPSERIAFELHALQSHLAVVAIRCQQDSQYQAFVTRHRGDLTGAYRTAQTHFRRAHGAQSVRRFDGYATDLANAHDQDAARFESFLCRDNAELYQQATNAPNAAALVTLANERNVLETYQPELCPAQPAQAARPARSSSARRR